MKNMTIKTRIANNITKTTNVTDTFGKIQSDIYISIQNSVSDTDNLSLLLILSRTNSAHFRDSVFGSILDAGYEDA